MCISIFTEGKNRIQIKDMDLNLCTGKTKLCSGLNLDKNNSS